MSRWSDIMYIVQDSQGDYSGAVFCSLLIIMGNYILVQLILAALLGHYKNPTHDEERVSLGIVSAALDFRGYLQKIDFTSRREGLNLSQEDMNKRSSRESNNSNISQIVKGRTSTELLERKITEENIHSEESDRSPTHENVQKQPSIPGEQKKYEDIENKVAINISKLSLHSLARDGGQQDRELDDDLASELPFNYNETVSEGTSDPLYYSHDIVNARYLGALRKGKVLQRAIRNDGSSWKYLIEFSFSKDEHGSWLNLSHMSTPEKNEVIKTAWIKECNIQEDDFWDVGAQSNSVKNIARREAESKEKKRIAEEEGT